MPGMPGMPGMPQRVRVISYIDGFNLYFGMRDSGLRRYLWLDLQLLSQVLLKPDQILLLTKYFTSRISGPSPKQQRQATYLEALATIAAKDFQAHYGKFQETPRLCQNCGKRDMVPGEKMTDVNIAVEMLADAFQNRFDMALLVSADSDLCPAIRRIRELFPQKQVIVAFPPGRRSTELEKLAHASFVIGKGRLKSAQFPEEITTSSGFVLKKPATWV